MVHGNKRRFETETAEQGQQGGGTARVQGLLGLGADASGGRGDVPRSLRD